MIDEQVKFEDYIAFKESIKLFVSGFINKELGVCDKYCYHNKSAYSLYFMNNFIGKAKQIIYEFQSQRPNRRKYYLIMNTGAHWSPHYMNYPTNDTPLSYDELLMAYDEYFNPSGVLMTQLNELVNDKELKDKNIQVIPIWRDTLPAGSCEYTKNELTWQYYELFSSYNQIARSSFMKYNYSTGPDNIWDALLPRYHDRIGSDLEDNLHYCEIMKNSPLRMVTTEILRTIGAIR